MKRLSGVVYAAFVVVALSVATLSGCGSDNPYELPEYQPGQAAGSLSEAEPGPDADGDPDTGDGPSGAGSKSSDASPSETEPIPTVSRQPSPASSAVTYEPADPAGEGAWVERGKVKARNQRGRAAVDAVVGYMTQRVQLSNTWQVDEDALAAVATGQAVSSARERALSQEAAGRRSTGAFVVNVSSVKIKDDRATVTGCHLDRTSEVDENGYQLVPPPGGVLISMEVEFAQGVWRVSSWPTEKVPTCKAAQK
ncbi:hypothetical protein [Kineosporia babensis]|uniref:Lipoprotein n=1 Tax=Kineosporia babensis TaxID=499548 RepID=A0A9X1NAN6_9ACTN|nr:hypothetical protein [Kineosporia babensis]MCD5310215.1 hypothetical protein [Kineosporia babensis]